MSTAAASSWVMAAALMKRLAGFYPRPTRDHNISGLKTRLDYDSIFFIYNILFYFILILLMKWLAGFYPRPTRDPNITGLKIHLCEVSWKSLSSILLLIISDKNHAGFFCVMSYNCSLVLAVGRKFKATSSILSILLSFCECCLIIGCWWEWN